ncbi:MAG: tRNA pseudouridine(13) synthase TruD [Nanoarchaeota archaeon]|nr:tRNA pseudouridine(13) synthase TruD [Nanoarchaeota archaeon]
MKIKQIPEDFQVKEIIKMKLEEGPYTYLKIKKKQWTTFEIIKKIGFELKIKEKRLSFAGIKDKQAITEQIISIFKIPKNCLKNIKIKGLKIEILGTGKEKIHSGLLAGNEFVITVRNLIHSSKLDIRNMPNYFDSQRFGKNSTNHIAGKALIKKDFQKACQLLDFKVENNDYVKALKKNLKLLKLILNSYQSYIFNQVLAEYVKSKSPVYKEIKTKFGKLIFSSYYDNIKIPLLSFDTQIKGPAKAIYQNILESEGISQKDFIIRQMPELLTLTHFRQGFVKILDLKSEIQKDELNPNRLKQIFRFRLPKGSYATIAIKAFFYLKISKKITSKE